MPNAADEAAQAEDLFRNELVRLIPNLRAYSRTMTRNESEANDLAQQALTNAWAKRHSFQPGTHLKAWLFTIARNYFLAGKRRSWRQTSLDPAMAESALLAPEKTDVPVELDEIRRALAALPDDQREALVLVWAGGFTYEEVAAIAGVAIGTIKSRVSRGKAMLVRTVEQGRVARDGRPAWMAGAALAQEAERLAAGNGNAKPRQGAADQDRETRPGAL